MQVHKDPSKFFSPDDVRDQELVTFADEGEEDEGKFGTRLKIGITTASGETKLITLNPTSKANLIDAYGEETKVWVGNQARVHITSSFVNKKKTVVIYLTHPNKDLEGNDIVQG